MAGTNCEGCYNCKKREVGCHAKCEIYLNWKKKYSENAKKIKKERNKINIGYYHK